MSRLGGIAGYPPGSTRDFDVTFQTVAGDWNSGSTPTTTARSLKIGGGVINAGSVLAGVTGQAILNWQATVKRTMWAMSNGNPTVGNGFRIAANPITIQPANKGGFSHKAGVSRFLCSMIASDAASPATGDVGMVMSFGNGAGNVGVLRSKAASTTVGATGFGIWLVGGVWVFGGKAANTAAATLTESIPLVVSPLELHQFEMRVYDAKFTSPARLDILVDKSVVLSRYWVNPAGIATPVLPAMSADFSGVNTGASLYPSVQNTTDGPAVMYYSTDIEFMHGLNDSGTL